MLDNQFVSGLLHGCNRWHAALLGAQYLGRQGRPEQRGKQECRRDRFVLLDAQVGVDQGIADQCMGVGRVVFQRLGTGREQRFEQFKVHQHFKGGSSMPGEEQFEHFFEQACRRNIAQHRCQRANRLGAVLFDAEVQLGSKAHRTQHAHRVFLVALFGVADQADQTVTNVVYAIGVIQNTLADRIVIQRVDREVATLGVLFKRAVHVVTQNAPAFIARGLVAVLFFVILGMIGAEGRHFDDFTTEMDMHQLEPAANDSRITEFGTHLFRRGAGGDVEILGRDIEHHVAYAAADQIGLVAGVLQALDDINGITAELAALQRMLAAIEHFRRGTRMLLRFAQWGTK